jgi:hypothetical protein
MTPQRDPAMEARWQRWQATAAVDDRRTSAAMTGLATMIAAALSIALILQLI